MADPVGTDPQADPIGQASVAVASANIKTFGDTQLQYNNMMLGNAIANQQSMNAFSHALMARCTDMILDKTANSIANSVLDQQGAKIANTTPPVYQDPTNGLAAVAAQLSTVVQMLQGLNIAPASTTKA